MISFLWPMAFLLLPLPILARYRLPTSAERKEGALKVPFYSRFSRVSEHSVRGNANTTVRQILFYVIWLSLIVALARPSWVGEAAPLPREGRDLMMAIDLSASMEEMDLATSGQPATRLDVVKAAADDFVHRREGDRLGLILFSDRAYLQAPLTFDRDVVRTLLEEARIGLTGQKTALGDAVAVGLKRLRDRQGDSKVLILLTDGVNNAGIMSPLRAAEMAKELGVRIYTIGVGAESMVVNTPFGRQRVNPSQQLDEATLKKIAKVTGGQYFRATDVEGLAAVYRDIDALEPVSGEDTYVRPQVALYYWPAMAALLFAGLLGVSMVLPVFVNRSSTMQGKSLSSGELL